MQLLFSLFDSLVAICHQSSNNKHFVYYFLFARFANAICLLQSTSLAWSDWILCEVSVLVVANVSILNEYTPHPPVVDITIRRKRNKNE